MAFLYLVLIILVSLVLIKSADYVVVSIKKVSQGFKIGTFGISAIILTLGTSFPELFVGLTSSVEQKPGLSLGVIIGSNIANIALITALATIIAGRVRVHEGFLKRSVITALLAGTLPFLLILDSSINRLDGVILILLYIAYVLGFFNNLKSVSESQEHEHTFIYRFIKKANNIDGKSAKEFARLFLGTALMLLSADIIVKLSSSLAILINIPIFVVGLVVLAIGTSLPEFAFALRSIKDGEPMMFLGNILGSIVVNSTLIIGLTSIISPITAITINQNIIALSAFVVIFLIFWFFIHSKNKLERWEAVLLVVLYISFLILEFGGGNR